MKAIADTGFLVAFGNRSDHYHAWAVAVAQTITDPLLTCDAVLSEAAFQLRSSAFVLDLVRDGMLHPDFEVARHIPPLAALALRYRERRPDFADLCLIRMSELHPQHLVITTDTADFRVYRRNRREAIPLLTPDMVG